MSKTQKNKRFCWLPVGGNNGDYLGGNANIISLCDDDLSNLMDDAILIDFGNAYCHTDKDTDYVIPDLDEYFPAKHEKKKSKLKAIVLTHYHDDHIKGLADAIIRNRDLPPIIGSKMTLKMLDLYLKRQGCNNYYKTIVAEDYKEIDVNGWKLKPFPVSHSTTDCKGFVVEKDGKRLVHMGDFKLDQTTMLGPKTDIEFLRQLGKEGVDCLILDSTKAEQEFPYFYTDKGTKNYISGIIRNHQDSRVVFVVYGGYLELIGMMITAAAENKRNIIVSGSYIKENIKAFEEVHGPIDQFIEKQTGEYVNIIDDEHPLAQYYKEKDTIIICDGDYSKDRFNFFRKSQYHRYYRHTNCPLIHPADKFFITRSIVENDKTGDLKALFNELTGYGYKFFWPNEHKIKARGHAPWHDLKDTIGLLKPKLVIPAYGKRKMLKAADERIKKEFGDISMVVKNGELVDISKPKDGVLKTIKFNWAAIKYRYREGILRPLRERRLTGKTPNYMVSIPNIKPKDKKPANNNKPDNNKVPKKKTPKP